MLDAIRTALQLIAPLPKADETERLVRQAGALRATVESWRESTPGRSTRENVLQQVLRLHVEATKLARSVPGRPLSKRPGSRPTPLAPPALHPTDDDDRPTLPPDFDIEAFAKETTAPNSQRRLASTPPESARSVSDAPSGSRSVVRFPTPAASSFAAAEKPASGLSAEERTAQMLESFTFGEYAVALELADELLKEVPDNVIARTCRENCRRTLERIYAERIGPLDRAPLVVRSASTDQTSMDHRAGFLLSLMDGATTVEAILDLCGMPKWTALGIVDSLLQRRVIRMEGVARKVGRR